MNMLVYSLTDAQSARGKSKYTVFVILLSLSLTRLIVQTSDKLVFKPIIVVLLNVIYILQANIHVHTLEM